MSQHRFLKKLLILTLVLALLITAAYFAIEPIQRMIYPMKYSDTVEKLAEQCQLPPSLIYAVIYAESKFDPSATSSAGAKGLMQITDDTYRWAAKRAGETPSTLDPNDLYLPEENIRIGCYVLALLHLQFADTNTVLAAYNAGQGRVREWLSNPDYSQDGETLTHIPYEETENYVRRVINTQSKYQALYNIQ